MIYKEFCKGLIICILSFLLLGGIGWGADGFTQKDRELLIELKAKFEEMDKRFEQIMTFLWILTAIFITLTLGVIGFAYWDRRTILRRAKEEAVMEIEREGRLRDLIGALRELAKEDRKLAQVLRGFNLI